MKIPALACALALGVLALAAPPAAARDDRVPGSREEITLTFAPVVRRAAPAVVNIYARRVVETRASPFANDPFFSQLFGLGPVIPRVENSLGSGVIVDPSGIIVSNFHVVGGATDIRVVLADGREFDARVQIADRESDLAVLRLEGARELPTLELADSDAVEVGDLVLAIGNPFGVGQTVTSGIVSGLARSGLAAGNRMGYFIQTDAPINPGNSGGALVEMRGRLLGINTLILSRSGGSNGIGFAIPANLVAQYVAAARAGAARLVRPWIGVEVQPVDGALAEAMGLDRPRGVVITRIDPRGPLAGAGLEPGDVILALDGKRVDAPAELGFRLMTLGTGRSVRLDYLRNGRSAQAEIALDPPPEDPPREPVTVAAPTSLGGLTVVNANPAVIDEMDLPAGTTGVVVVAVEGHARRTGLQPGDVILAINGMTITSTRDVAALGRSRPPGWEILFERNGRRSVIRIRDR